MRLITEGWTCQNYAPNSGYALNKDMHLTTGFYCMSHGYSVGKHEQSTFIVHYLRHNTENQTSSKEIEQRKELQTHTHKQNNKDM